MTTNQLVEDLIEHWRQTQSLSGSQPRLVDKFNVKFVQKKNRHHRDDVKAFLFPLLTLFFFSSQRCSVISTATEAKTHKKTGQKWLFSAGWLSSASATLFSSCCDFFSVCRPASSLGAQISEENNWRGRIIMIICILCLRSCFHHRFLGAAVKSTYDNKNESWEGKKREKEKIATRWGHALEPRADFFPPTILQKCSYVLSFSFFYVWIDAFCDIYQSRAKRTKRRSRSTFDITESWPVNAKSFFFRP